MKYIPALDGLRAIAILTVIASHCGAEHFVPGGFGVTLFFFISGYLITGLLIKEHDVTGTISISAFYARRFLRLAPALLVMVICVALTYEAFMPPICGSQLSAAVFYYMNYYVIFGGATPLPLGVLWSLAVEEHYYLFFPLLLAVGWRWPRIFLLFLITVTVTILAWRMILVLHFNASVSRVYYATDTRIDSILFGAMFATATKITSVRWLAHPATYLAGFALLLFTFVYRDPSFRETWRYTLQGVAIVPLFYRLLSSESVVRSALESAPLVWIGKLSYSLYLWHFAVLRFIARATMLDYVPTLVIACTVAVALAAASYYVIEIPFQRLRNKYRPKPTPPLPVMAEIS